MPEAAKRASNCRYKERGIGIANQAHNSQFLGGANISMAQIAAGRMYMEAR
jgi:hypothetical protein